MRCYASSDLVVAAANKTFITILSASSRRPHIEQIITGCTDAPDDTTAVFLIKPITVDGTGTAGHAYANDPKDGTAICTVKTNYTIEPTFVTSPVVKILAYITYNQRASVVWSPPLESEVTCEISSGTEIGLAIQMLSGKTGANYVVTVVWEE